MWLNIGCGPFLAPAPWTNLDVVTTDTIRPDIVVDDPLRPLDGYVNVERVYMGHVLEHVPWPEVADFLVHVRERMAPGGELMVVCPDVFRVIRRWRDGLDPEGWELVESILEGPWDRDYGDAPGYALLERLPLWPYARHWWNAFEARVRFAVEQWGGFEKVEALPITEEALAGWPVVAHTQWQCAVRGVAW